MRKKMNIITWMGIFLVIIQSTQCDSSFFRERHWVSFRNIRDTGRRLMKFDSPSRTESYRNLDKRKFLSKDSFAFENDGDDAISTTDSDSGTIFSFRLNRKTIQVPKFSDRNMRSRRISMNERSIRKSVIELLPEVNKGTRLPKMLTFNGDVSLKATEPIRTRRDTGMQKKFLNERKYRLSEDRRMNRQNENIKLRRSNIRSENGSDKRMSNMRFRDTEMRKTISLAKREISEFSTPAVSREIALFHRQTRSSAFKRFSFENRMRNTVRQQTTVAERYIRKSRYQARNLPNLKLNEISLEQIADSKLQQPRYERHLLVPKRELKIPSDELRDRTTNSRRYRKSTKANDIGHGLTEETLNERKTGRGLRRTLDKRMDSNRRRSVESVAMCRQNRLALHDSSRNINQQQTRRSAQNNHVKSVGRIQNLKRANVLDFTRRNTEAPIRSVIALYQAIENNSSIRRLRFSDLNSNRYQESRCTRRKINPFSRGRVRFDGEKIYVENKKLSTRNSNRVNNKENIPNDSRINSRSVRNQVRAGDSLKNRMKRTVENDPTRKQRNAIVTRSDERFLTKTRSQVNRRSYPAANDKLREVYIRSKGLRIRDGRIAREMNMEKRSSFTRLEIPFKERFVKFSDDYRTYPNNQIVNVRNIVIGSLRSSGNKQMERFDEKEPSSVDINIRKANRRIASNQQPVIMVRNIHVRSENQRHVPKEQERYRYAYSRSRRFEARMTTGRVLRSLKTRGEFKQSKLIVSLGLVRESSVRTGIQTRKEIGREVARQQRKISMRSQAQHFVSIPKVRSTAMNSTFKEGVRSVVSLEKPAASSDRTTLYRSITTSKSSSSNKSFNDFYDYLSEKRSSFISLILNVILGLAVIVVSSDDKNKGFIPRRLTPFVDGFLKYTTVL